MAKTIYEITQSGQVIRKTLYEEVLENPDALIKLMATGIEEKEPIAKAPTVDPTVRCLYMLGDGVSAFRKKMSGNMYYWNALMIDTLNFYTDWELLEDPKVNGGQPYLVPYIRDNPGGEIVDFGGPIPIKMPDDLVMHFVTEHAQPEACADLQLPEAHDIGRAAAKLGTKPLNSYLTCFSKSRNTCLMLPLPNIYLDCHICIGSTYNGTITNPTLHVGPVSSVKAFHQAWYQSKWNDHLLNGEKSDLTKMYKKFMRLDAESLEPLPYEGCEDWPVAAPIIPVEEMYKPWIVEN